jgi:hypothetical protein
VHDTGSSPYAGRADAAPDRPLADAADELDVLGILAFTRRILPRASDLRPAPGVDLEGEIRKDRSPEAADIPAKPT